MIQNVPGLLRAAPEFHRDVGGRKFSAHLNEEGLLFLERRLSPGMASLETGVGYSTIVCALSGASHTAISPSQREVDEIEDFCGRNGVSLEAVTFVVEASDQALPRLETESLDLVLIDGNHGFPLPFIDWHYSSSLLKVGGHLLIDDLEVWPAKALCDFLKKEDWWAHETDLCAGRTAVFRKIGERPPPIWQHQPYVMSRSDLSLVLLRTRSLKIMATNPARLVRDLVVRAGRTARAHARHLGDPSVPPPFRRRAP